MTRIRVEFAEGMSLQHIDPRLHFAVAVTDAAGCQQRFVIPGDAGKAQLVFLRGGKCERLDNGGSDP